MYAIRISKRSPAMRSAKRFLTHTSTSPNQQLLASLDLARRQVDIEGFQLVRRSTTWRWCSATASAKTG